MMDFIYSDVVKTLNNLPYHLDSNNKSWITEQDIIDYLCKGDSVFFMKYFIGETYINIAENNNAYPVLNAMIAIHEVFEKIADLEEKTETEDQYIENVFPFIISLARIGIKEIDNNRPPIEVMEEMIIKGDS